MSAPAVKSQWPSPLKQSTVVWVSSWLGPSSGKSVTAVLLAAEPDGAGSKLSIDDATANPDISRFILLPSTTPKQKSTPRLLVVGDFYRIRFRVRLTGQNESFVEVLLLQHVVQLGVARPRHGVSFAVQLYHRGGRRHPIISAVAGVVNCHRRERI